MALVKDSNRDDEVFVVNFNDTAYLDNPKDKDFTNDIGELEDRAGPDRCPRRNGHARRHRDVDPTPEEGAARQEGTGGDHRRQRQFQPTQSGTDHEERAPERRVDLRSRPVERGRAPRSLPRPAGAQRPGRGHRRQDVLSQGRGGSGRDRASGGARHPQPVHHRIFAANSAMDDTFRAITDYGQGSGQPQRAHAKRLLRHARREDRGK